MKSSALIAAVVLSCTGLAVSAQQPGQPAPAVTAPPRSPFAQAEQNPLGSLSVSIEFPGGTLAQYVAEVREAAGEGRLNVIVPQIAADLRLPPVSLKNAGIGTAIESLSYLIDRSVAMVRTERIGKEDTQSATYIVFCERARASSGMPAGAILQGEPRVSRVYAIRDLSESPAGIAPTPETTVSYERILDVVKASSSLDADKGGAPTEGPPEMMLHKDSGLLIVRGTESQQRLIESVLSSLNGLVRPKREEALAAARAAEAWRQEQVALKAAVEQAEISAANAERRMQDVAARAEELKKRHDAGLESSLSVDASRAAMDDATNQRRMAESKLRELREQLNIQTARREAGAAAAPTEAAVQVVYEIGDLHDFREDIYRMCDLVVKSDWKSPIVGDGKGDLPDARFAILNSWKNERAQMRLQATPTEHRLIVQFLNSLRRAKTNEPGLPGLDAEDLIRKAGEK